MVKGYVIKKENEEEPVPPEEEEAKIERLPTGIEELDKGLEGGIPLGSWVVISGEPGSGKTVLTQHITASALKHNFRVVTVSTELKLWEWLAQAKSLHLPVDTYPIARLKDIYWFDKKEGVFKLKRVKDLRTIFIDVFTLWDIARNTGISERKEKKRSKWYSYLDVPVLAKAVDLAFRYFSGSYEGKYYNLKHNILLTVDSLSVFYLRAPALASKIALDLSLRFKRSKVIALLTTHYAQTTGATFGFKVEHIADGVFHLWMDSVEKAKEVRRYLIIKKMRMTKHSLSAYRLFIEKDKGIRLEPYKTAT